MVSFTDEQVRAHLLRMEGNKARQPKAEVPEDATDDELGLHDQIISDCRKNRWPYIHARTDQKSSIGLGIHDITVYVDGGRVLNVECKRRGGKMSPYQISWKVLMEQNGHRVEIIYSYTQWLDLLKQHGLKP